MVQERLGQRQRATDVQASPSRSPRRPYLDWLRGLAVLIMIEAHVIDSWTRLDVRDTPLYGWSMILGGFGAPLFLFLAGVSVSLSAGSKARRSGDTGAASRAVARRGLQIFGLAFLFRVQAMIVSWGAWRSLLKVDILNVMGPAIVAAAGCWALARTQRGRILVFLLATLAATLLTPPVRATALLDFLPDAIEGYIRPRPGFTTFAIFPWAGFVFAGALIGVLIEATRTAATERRLGVWLAPAGAALILGGYAASYLPSPYARSDFWTSSPTFFILRCGVLTLALAVAYWWEQRPARRWQFSPLQQMGRTSLFIYWIHIELIYGLIVRPLHKSLTLGQAWVGVLSFALAMLLVSLLKDRIVLPSLSSSARLLRSRTEPEGRSKAVI
jgi:uncharacterized membrane protein